MLIYPAIDLKDGKCVRLKKGIKDDCDIFSDNPVQQALEFENAGFQWLHIVDLDGAFSGHSKNTNSILEILKNTKVQIQIGGGIRSLDDIKYWLDQGVSRVILGTIACTNPVIVEKACVLYGKSILVSLDANNGLICIKGWIENSNISILDMALRCKKLGVSTVVYTDISRDGVLKGVDIEGVKKIIANTEIKVIASGGVSGIKDIQHLKTIIGVDGVIIGRAFYEKKLSYIDALGSVK